MMEVVLRSPGAKIVRHKAEFIEQSATRVTIQLIDFGEEVAIAQPSGGPVSQSLGRLGVTITLTPAVPGQDLRLLRSEIPPLVHVSFDKEAFAKKGEYVREGVTWPHWQEEQLLFLEPDLCAGITQVEALAIGQTVSLFYEEFVVKEIRGIHKIRWGHGSSGLETSSSHLSIAERVVLEGDLPDVVRVSSLFTPGVNEITLASVHSSWKCVCEGWALRSGTGFITLID